MPLWSGNSTLRGRFPAISTGRRLRPGLAVCGPSGRDSPHALQEAGALTAAARTTLAQRRVAETAAETALAAAISAQAAAMAQREQVMLEDVARALKRAAN